MNRVTTQTDLAAGLAQLGVTPGIALEVHSSLKVFGPLEGGAETLIETLLRAVGRDGAIVMPAFRLSKPLPLTDGDRALGLTLKIRILGEDEEPSGMGRIADAFRKRPDVATGTGIFRTAAWGSGAQAHAASGFQRLIDQDGSALLLGVDIYSLSAMHYVEDCLPEAIRQRFRPSPEARARYPEGQWLIEAWTPEAKPWHRIQALAYDKGYIQETRIGSATCRLLKIRPVIGLYREALEQRPLELYGLQ